MSKTRRLRSLLVTLLALGGMLPSGQSHAKEPSSVALPQCMVEGNQIIGPMNNIGTVNKCPTKFVNKDKWKDVRDQTLKDFLKFGENLGTKTTGLTTSAQKKPFTYNDSGVGPLKTFEDPFTFVEKVKKSITTATHYSSSDKYGDSGKLAFPQTQMDEANKILEDLQKRIDAGDPNIFNNKQSKWDASIKDALGDDQFLDEGTGICLKLKADKAAKLLVVDVVPINVEVVPGENDTTVSKKLVIDENAGTLTCLPLDDVKSALSTCQELKKKSVNFVSQLGSSLLVDTSGIVRKVSGEIANVATVFPGRPKEEQSYQIGLGKTMRDILSLNGLKTLNKLDIPLTELLWGLSSKTPSDKKMFKKKQGGNVVVCDYRGEMLDAKGNKTTNGIAPDKMSEAFVLNSDQFKSLQMYLAGLVKNPEEWKNAYWKAKEDEQSLMLLVKKTKRDDKEGVIFTTAYEGKYVKGIKTDGGVEELELVDEIDQAKLYEFGTACDLLDGETLDDSMLKDLMTAGFFNRNFRYGKNRTLFRTGAGVLTVGGLIGGAYGASQFLKKSTTGNNINKTGNNSQNAFNRSRSADDRNPKKPEVKAF